jgi:hypothetical protein
MAVCRSSSENTGKKNSIPNLNKTSPWAHMESELDVLGVPEKLVKYVIYSSKRKIEKKRISSQKLPKMQSTTFWFQGVLEVK